MSFERSNILDTALYKNIPLPFFLHRASNMPSQIAMMCYVCSFEHVFAETHPLLTLDMCSLTWASSFMVSLSSLIRQTVAGVCGI